MRNRRLTRIDRQRKGIRPLFSDGSPVARGLMHPGFFTRITDRVVSFFAQFELEDEYDENSIGLRRPPPPPKQSLARRMAPAAVSVAGAIAVAMWGWWNYWPASKTQAVDAGIKIVALAVAGVFSYVMRRRALSRR